MVSKRLTLSLAFFFTLLFAAPAMASSVGLVVNGQVRSSETPPRIENGRVLVPLRTAAEALNASVDFYPDIKGIVITKKSTRVALTVNSTLATLGGSVITLDTPPVIYDGRTLVPLRFLGEAFGIYVAWDSVTKTAYLSETVLYLPGRTKPLSKDTPTY
ncbi:MAG: copper amine oxidase N-terminal domain-containing protein, partial [Firmicutes bacterium]|nr:copper amine oxidase N-terminal domain-containing protein [Bacillota bacterium]